ncbi:MAG: hypothetical protein IKB15_05480 [Alistipes sp.]|nr:hypothetical protein [Alistipes sp.]
MSIYREVGNRLMAAIGGKEYFSGSIDLTHGDVECRLTCTLFIRRDQQPTEGRCFRPVTALIPVWWEFSTSVGGEERMNDFSFRELTELLF